MLKLYQHILYHFIDLSEMEVDETKSKHDRKTLKDEHGQYPVWMNQKIYQETKKSKEEKQRQKKEENPLGSHLLINDSLTLLHNILNKKLSGLH